MEAYQQFILCTVSVVVAVIAVKIFNTFWYCVEKKVAPGRVPKPADTPEAVFKDLRDKRVVVHLKTGEVLEPCLYRRTLFFNEGDFAINTAVYFEFERPDGNTLFVSGVDILKIETVV